VGRLPDDLVRDVRGATDLVALAGRYTALRRCGADRFVGRCPLHEDRTPSFTVSPSKQLFKCFGCDAGGDAVTFVELAEGLDFRGAVERLASEAGVAIPESNDPFVGSRRQTRRARELQPLDRAAAFYAAHLWSTRCGDAGRAVTYLAERRISEATCRQFTVGFAPGDGTSLLQAATAAGFSMQELRDVGLVARARGGPLQDRFRGRLMLPICDLDGRVLGFGARRLDNSRGPKYVNSPASAIFSKRELLFGTHHARGPAAKAGVVVVVEGYVDMLAMHEVGISNAVALMGTAVSEHQIAVMKRLAPKILLVLDGDDAGQDAADRVAALAQEQKLETCVATLPRGSDPAALLERHGHDAARAELADACDRAIARRT
jgi:DNA primase